ncbi:hypothetical protein ADIS_1504 [Lunatimonas lonarensis]|uniref:DUF2961 domain-containing protein n=2 Tax=Lunatimonas lonarensis TaxID=1232681 RepID=R7ZUZ7_9BACT|nr:hypothetical protein ADIS_1504 [Lunatimonas lonarensis]
MYTTYFCRVTKHTLLFSLLVWLVLGSLTSCQDKEEIDLSGLLHEMIDRDKITRFPKVGYKSLQASSYNRESVSPDLPGWFADSDGIGFIRTEEVNGSTEWVIMEDDGPGVISKIWAVCFYYSLEDTTGGNIKIYLDGDEQPVINTNFFSLVKGQDFIKPPFAEESTRAGNLYFPIPYAKSCKITTDKPSFYNIINYRKYPEGTPVKTFTIEEFERVLPISEKVASVLSNPPNQRGPEIVQRSVLKNGEVLHVDLPTGSFAVSHLEINIHSADNLPQALRSTVLTGIFDGDTTVWCPVGDFFNNVGKVTPYTMWERSVEQDGTMVNRWMMPYMESGAISLTNLYDLPVDISVKVVAENYRWDEASMHFYATWRMDPPTPTFPLFDWNFLSAEGKGVVVGDQWTVLNPAEGWWGEGDEKIYVDDDFEANFPSHFGTGTEDYYGWAGGLVPTPEDQFSKPFLGNIIVGEPRSQGYNVCTRTRVLDAIPFQNRLKFDFESSCGIRQSWFYLQYSQTTFWYGRPGVAHNRQSDPKMASATLPTVEDLQRKIDLAKKERFVVDNAIEAEYLIPSNMSDSVVENFSEIGVWGETSNEDMKNLWFTGMGDFVEFSLTEQFEKSNVRIALAVGEYSGIFDIYVNDTFILSQDLYSNHPGITTPYINLGLVNPVSNSFKIKFVLKGINQAAKRKEQKSALGIDFFLVENDFLKR